MDEVIELALTRRPVPRSSEAPKATPDAEQRAQ